MAKSFSSIPNPDNTGSKSIPLDLQEIQVTHGEGRRIKVPAIDKYFMEPRQFVLYKPPPSFDDFEDLDSTSVSAAKEEWVQRMEYLQEDLHWLLKLSHHRFWSQVVYDDSLHECLDSYLSHAPRDFDLNCCQEEDLLAVSQMVHKLIFFVFLRMSTYKESKKDYISPEAFGEMIYENYLFDVPKMMDLCVLYGRKNGAILKKMISNIFNTRPTYIDDLETAVPHLSVVFDLVEAQLHLNQSREEMAPAKLGEHAPLGISSVPTSDLLDVIYYVADISSSVNAFTEIYPQSCQVFYRHGTVTRVASFYDTVFPPIENELQIRETEEMKKIVERFKHKVQLAKTSLVKIFRNLITACCVQPIVESQYSKHGNGQELACFHLEEFMGIFTEVVAYKHFICDYSKMFPFKTDVMLLSEAGVNFDPTSLDYIFSSIDQYSDSVVCNGGLPYPNKVAEESKKNYRHSALKQRDVQNLQGLAATLTNGTLSAKGSEADLSSSGAAASSGNDVELESLIDAVLDVLSGFGPGFIEECLNYYNFDTEKVIDALLQDTLPDSLQTLDRSLQRIPVPNDEEPPSILKERRNVYDHDEFDFFNRQDVDMQRIHQGKKNKTPDTYQGLSDDKSDITALLKEISLSAAYEQEGGDYFKEPDLYEDEYDDTYDSNMVGLVELQTEKELQSIRPFTTPRVLEQRKESPDLQSTRYEDAEAEEAEEPPAPRRDEFVPNPAVEREKAEQRRQSRMARNRGPHGPRENEGQGRPQQNRQHKEKHKGQIANHNRRRQADHKRSRGMGALPTR